MSATCGGCDRHWTTTAEAHCGTCHHPATTGLTERDGTWATPEGHEAAQRSRERLDSARTRQCGPLRRP